jgi:cardiolipin synthase
MAQPARKLDRQAAPTRSNPKSPTMKQRLFVHAAICLLALLILNGCATAGPRSAYLAKISPASVTNLAAYASDNTVEMQYPLRGRSAFAHATWLPVRADTTNYQCQFAVLTFDKQKRSLRRSVIGPENRLTIRDATEWRQLLLKVFTSLAPDHPGHGALLLNQQMELVLYRDTNGVLKTVPLEEKPADVSVDRTCSDQDFSRALLQLLAHSATANRPNQNRFLYLTGKDPAFVVVEPQKHLVVFLAFPADPDAAPVVVPGGLALRAVNSIVIKSLLLTAIKSPVTLITRGLWMLGNSGMTVANSLPGDASAPPPPLYQGPAMDLAAWEKELDGVVLARPYQGRIDFLVDGREFFPEFIRSVENAKRSVDVMVYVFSADNYATQVADVLKQKSGSVRVRVLMDDLGSLFAAGAPESAVPPSFESPDDMKPYLKASSDVHVRVTSDPWLATDHRKCFIVDSRQAFVGGMNIGWVYRYQWHDLMMGITGPVVGRLQKDFRKAWAFAGPFGDFGYAWASLFDREHLRRNREPGDIDIRVLRTATGKLQIYHAQLAAIRRARRYIYIENAYFNDDTILRELIAARQRGVDVRVILPADNDVTIMQTGNLVMANEMISHGIRVYFYPGMTHVKAAIYDGWACVGSANLEKLSLRISQEMDLAFSDPSTVDRLKRELFLADFARAQEINSPVALNWWDPFLKALADQL